MTAVNDVVSVEVGWHKTWALLPHKTLSKRWVWLQPIFARRVWRYTGFIDEPFTEYGTLFDVLTHLDPP